MCFTTLPIELLWAIIEFGEFNLNDLKELRLVDHALARNLAPLVITNVAIKLLRFRRWTAKDSGGLSTILRPLATDDLSENFRHVPRVLIIKSSGSSQMKPSMNDEAVKLVLDAFPNLRVVKLKIDAHSAKSFVSRAIAAVKKHLPVGVMLHLQISRLQAPYLNSLDEIPSVTSLDISGYVEPVMKPGDRNDVSVVTRGIQNIIRRSPNLECLKVNFQHLSLDAVLEDFTAIKGIKTVDGGISTFETVNRESIRKLPDLQELSLCRYSTLLDSEGLTLSPFPLLEELGMRLTTLRTRMLDETLLDYIEYASDTLKVVDIAVQSFYEFRYAFDRDNSKFARLCNRFWRRVFPMIAPKLREFSVVPFINTDLKHLNQSRHPPPNASTLMSSIDIWSAEGMLNIAAPLGVPTAPMSPSTVTMMQAPPLTTLNGFSIAHPQTALSPSPPLSPSLVPLEAPTIRMDNLETISIFLVYSKRAFDRFMSYLETCPKLKKVNLYILNSRGGWRYRVKQNIKEAYAEIEHVDHGKRNIDMNVQMDVSLWGLGEPWWRDIAVCVMKEYSWGGLGWEGRRSG